MPVFDDAGGGRFRRPAWQVFLQVVLQIYTLFRNIVADRRAAEQAARASAAEARRQAEVEALYLDPTPSGRLANGRTGTLEDARAAGLVNGGKGLFIGALDGVALSYVGEAHGLIICKTGGGKGIYATGHTLANWQDGVLVVVEVKNGEAAYMAAQHRLQFGPVHFLSPHGTLGIKSTSIDLMGGVKMAVTHLDSPHARAMEIATTLWPDDPSSSEATWPIKGARQVFAMFACETAAHGPEACTLTDAYLFGERGNDEIKADLEIWADSDAPGDVAGKARKYISMIESAPKQWEAIKDSYTEALAPYAPGERYAAVTAPGGLDLAAIKGTKATIFVIGDGASAAVDAPWAALVTNALIDGFYRAPGQGKVLFLLEELLALPRLHAVERALNLYRSGGIQIVAVIQSRAGLIAKYGREIASTFELQAGFVRAWVIDDPELLRDYEYLAGKTSVVVRNFSAQDNAFQHAGFGLGEVMRPVLHPDEIRLLGRTKQLVRVDHCPLLVVDLVAHFEVAQYATALRDPRALTRDTVIAWPP